MGGINITSDATTAVSAKDSINITDGVVNVPKCTMVFSGKGGNTNFRMSGGLLMLMRYMVMVALVYLR